MVQYAPVSAVVGLTSHNTRSEERWEIKAGGIYASEITWHPIVCPWKLASLISFCIDSIGQ